MVAAHIGRAGLGRREILISHQANRLWTGTYSTRLARAIEGGLGWEGERFQFLIRPMGCGPA